MVNLQNIINFRKLKVFINKNVINKINKFRIIYYYLLITKNYLLAFFYSGIQTLDPFILKFTEIKELEYKPF